MHAERMEQSRPLSLFKMMIDKGMFLFGFINLLGDTLFSDFYLQ